MPDGDRAVCSISVIDNVTRITVQSLEFNTDELNMSVGASAELIPIINPKDVFNNGMLNSNLTWSSTNESVASVSDGKITAKSKGTAVIKEKGKELENEQSVQFFSRSGSAAGRGLKRSSR